MNRQLASTILRDLLDQNGLKDWHVRLTTDFTKPFLGMCSYKDTCIILNAAHVDTHPDAEVLNTIRHEVAHALLPGQGHNETWKAKARELGCDNTQECANYTLSPLAIDAIRSGASLEVEFTEETQVIRTPKYKVTRLQDKCPVCGKVAKTVSSKETRGRDGVNRKVVTLECGHMTVTEADSQSPFELLTFDGSSTCKHDWNKSVCRICNAKRLYPFQVEGCRQLETANGKLGFFDEMGLGKTIQPLAYLKFHPEKFPLLWVTKSGIKYQHAKEIVRLLGDKYTPQIIATGKDYLLPGIKVYIASYDIFRRSDLEKFKKAGIKTIVMDECQAIKNPDSSRTQSIRQVVKEIPNVIPLSGTPWKNRGSEFFVVLNMLDPKRFYSYEQFKKQWVDTYWDMGRQKEGGIRDPKRFKEYIADLAIRRERKDVLPELPEISRTRLISEVPEHARKSYNVELEKLTGIMNQAALDGTEGTFNTQKKAMESLIVMRQIVGMAKVDATVEFAQEFIEETDRKLVIFVHHIACGQLILAQMEKWCAENNYPQPLKLTADMDAQSRWDVQDKFNGPNYRLLIASTLASGEGLNLQSCSDCVIHERQWNPANEEQAEGRFIRIGQQATAVNATYVHGDDTIDTVLDAIIERKRFQFHAAMNTGEVPTWNEASIISELINALTNRKAA